MNKHIFDYILMYLPIDMIYILSLVNHEWKVRIRKRHHKFRLPNFRKAMYQKLVFKKQYIDYFSLLEQEIMFVPKFSSLEILVNIKFGTNWDIYQFYEKLYKFKKRKLIKYCFLYYSKNFMNQEKCLTYVYLSTQYGLLDVVDYFLKLGLLNRNIEYNVNNMETLNFCIQNQLQIHYCIASFLSSGNIEMLKFIFANHKNIQKHETKDNVSECFENFHSLDHFKLYFETFQVAEDIVIEYLKKAINFGNLDFIRYLQEIIIFNATENTHKNFDDLVFWILDSWNLDVFKLFFENIYFKEIIYNKWKNETETIIVLHIIDYSSNLEYLDYFYTIHDFKVSIEIFYSVKPNNINPLYLAYICKKTKSMLEKLDY